MDQKRKLPVSLEIAFQAAKEAEKSLKGKLEQFELFYMSSYSTKIDSRNQKIDSFIKAQDSGISIRVKKEGKIGFSYTTSSDPKSIQDTVQSSIEIAQWMPNDPDAELGGYSSGSLQNWKDPIDRDGLQTPIQEKIKQAHLLEALCRDTDSRITDIRSASLNESFYEVHLLDHRQTHLHYAGTRYSVGVTCKAEEKGESQSGHESLFNTHLKKLQIQEVAKNAALSATELLGARSIKSGKYRVIIRNDVVSELLDFLSASFSGEEIFKKKSLLMGKLNEKVFSSKITLVDNPLDAGGYFSRPFDAEGSPSQKTTLIEKGIFKNILLNRTFAKKLGLSNTAKASRSITTLPVISPSNWWMSPGALPFEGLLKQAHEGIVITQLMGVHTANPVTGAFSLGASGLYFNHGQISHPVKGFAVAGNILDLLRDTEEVGSDFKMFGNMGVCSIMVPELAISGDA